MRCPGRHRQYVERRNSAVSSCECEDIRTGHDYGEKYSDTASRTHSGEASLTNIYYDL